jgi:ribosomal-protein-alanine N-acetyltransferase/ribosomal-protein-serine acetyltransferase
MNLGDAHVRPFAIGDAPALHAAVRASIGSLSHMFPWCSADYAPADAEARVAACVAAWRDGAEYPFGIFAPGDGSAGERLLGCVGLNQLERAARSANLGYWIGEAHRGRGLATRAAAWTAAYGFGELGLARIEIRVLPENAASLRVAAKLGAYREAVLPGAIAFQGRRADAVLFSLSPGASP